MCVALWTAILNVKNNFKIPQIDKEFCELPFENLHHYSISFMKQQFVVTHTIRQTEISALPDSQVTNTTPVKILYPHKNCFYLHFRKKKMTCLNVGLLRICQVFVLSPVKLCIGGLRQIVVLSEKFISVIQLY
jgi:hypothetical protein